MKNKRIYLSSPHMGGTEINYIVDAFNSNWIAPLGPNVDLFEESISKYCIVNHVVALSSGTAALHLALIALGVKEDDEVLVSTFTFSATVNPIVYQGAIPIFIDSERESWNMDPELLEQAIKDRLSKSRLNKIKAIIVVHLYGMPAQIEKIIEIANEYNIPVIEDAAEALGSKFKGKPLGSFGKMSILSFNGNKIITTSGGGALLSNDKFLIERSRFLASQAKDNAPHYQHSKIGYNYRMSNVLAGIGRGQMEVIEDRVSKRREIYRYYKKCLNQYAGITFLEEPGREFFSNRWLTTILFDKRLVNVTRSAIQNKLEENNIETRPLWKPMHLQPIFSSYPSFLNGVSEDLFRNGLCLPSGSNMSENDLDIVTRVIKSVI